MLTSHTSPRRLALWGALLIGVACSDPVASSGRSDRISVISPAPSLGVGESLSLQVIDGSGARKDLGRAQVSWSSSDPSRARVSQDGIVTGLELGAVVITASMGSRSGSLSLNIGAPIHSLTVEPATLRIELGQCKVSFFSAALKDAAGNALYGRLVSWRISDESVAAIDSRGRVTPLSAGEATVSATAGGLSGTALLSVKEAGRGCAQPK